MGDRGTAWYRFIRALVRTLVYPALGGFRVLRREHEPLEGPIIVAPVHFSFLDPPIVACSMKRAITFMAKEELFKPFLFGPLIKSLGAFKVRRGSGDTEAIKLAIKLLKEGRAVLMFPEGTRGNGETLGQITAGAAMLAKRTGAKVLPVGIHGTYNVLPKGQSKPKRHRMVVAFGEPFTYADCEVEGDDKATREKFNQLLEDRLLEATRAAGLELKRPLSQKSPEKSLDPAPSNEAVDPAKSESPSHP